MKGIIAYGTEEDREKLAVLAQTFNLSGSQWIISIIREKYHQVYGETDPKRIIDEKQ